MGVVNNAESELFAAESELFVSFLESDWVEFLGQKVLILRKKRRRIRTFRLQNQWAPHNLSSQLHCITTLTHPFTKLP